MAYTCQACMNIPAVFLCVDRVRCQTEVSMVTEWDVKVTRYQPNANYKINILNIIKLGNSNITHCAVTRPGLNSVFCSDPIFTRPCKILAQSTTNSMLLALMFHFAANWLIMYRYRFVRQTVKYDKTKGRAYYILLFTQLLGNPALMKTKVRNRRFTTLTFI